MGFDHRYEEAAQQADVTVGRYTPGHPEFSLEVTADELVARFAKLADPAGIWSAERRLHEWCQATHNMSKKASPFAIDRVTIDTTDGWSGKPGCPQILFVQLPPSSVNFIAGEREAVALVYDTPADGRVGRVPGKVFSLDYEDLILGVCRSFPTDMAAVNAAKELRRAIRLLVDAPKHADLVPDSEAPAPTERPRYLGV